MELMSRDKIEKYLIDENFLPELKTYIPDFLNKRKNETLSLKNLIESGEFEEVRKVCHQWKGFCEPYGFRGLGELGKTLEKACVDQKRESALETLSLIEHYLLAKDRLLTDLD